MISKKHFFLIIFSIVVAFIGREIYKYSHMYDLAWDAPAFQTMGDENAPVTIIEFVDYNCPYCRTVHPVVQEVLNMRSDIHYIARPIGPLSDNSEKLVKLTLAAGLQGKFWEMHHAFLSYKGRINDKVADQIAEENGVDLEQLYADATGEEVNEYFRANVAASGALGIRFIPGFMINKTIFVPDSENLTAQDFLRVINDAT
ncbi:MAG: thioredoxin domain-containing protein [Pseudomonadota bacterium]